MSYTDTTITPEAGYTYVNYGQVYGTIATALGAHAAWSLDDTLDVTNGANLFRFWIWKCAAAQSGLATDFFVIFRARITVATGLYDVTTGAYGLGVTMAETYDSATKIASKLTTNNNSTLVTPEVDGSNPMTLTLNSTTAGQLASGATITGQAFLVSLDHASLTSQRMLMIVAKDALMTWAILGTGASSKGVYAGSFIPRLSIVDDPNPLMLARITNETNGYPTNTSVQAGIAYTRHPRVSANDRYYWGGAFYAGLITTNGNIYMNPGWHDITGELNTRLITSTLGGGQAPDLYGDIVSRVALGTYATSGTVATRGGLRGLMKYVRCTTATAPHSAGDTFLVDGKVHVGIGSTNYGVWDTEVL